MCLKARDLCKITWGGSDTALREYGTVTCTGSSSSIESIPHSAAAERWLIIAGAPA